MPRTRTPLRPLALGLVFIGLLVAWRVVAPSGPAGDGGAPAEPDPEAFGGTSTPAPGIAGAEPVRLDARGCFDAGYLCEGLGAETEPRILRWNDDVPRIVVHVSQPADLEPGRARALQRAAAAGIREWQGNPFPLRVDIGSDASAADVRVTWTRALNGRELGRVSSRWIQRGGGWQVEITEFALATHSPGSGRVLTPAQVELTAAHEMGHVLGLPHSDDPRDVMFPLNTSLRLTSRDFRTLGALYSLPVGARVEVVPDGR